MKTLRTSLLAAAAASVVAMAGASLAAQETLTVEGGYPDASNTASRQPLRSLNVALGGRVSEAFGFRVPRFDPALGTLNRVEFVPVSTVDHTVRARANRPFILPARNNIWVSLNSEFTYFAPGLQHAQNVYRRYQGEIRAAWPSNISIGWGAADLQVGPDVVAVDSGRLDSWIGAGQTNEIIVQVTNTYDGVSDVDSNADWTSGFHSQVEVRYHYTPRFVGRFDADLPGEGPAMIHFTLTQGDRYEAAAEGPLFDPTFDTAQSVQLGDDAFLDVPLQTSLRMPGGRIVNSIRIDSNGRITDTAAGMGSDYSATVQELLNAPSPIIAPVWTDLDPSSGGARVWIRQSTDRVTVTWENVPQYGRNNSNTIQVQIQTNGSITFFYPQLELDTGTQIIGLSPGGGVADPGATDLTVFTGVPAATIYEVFGGAPDFNTSLVSGQILAHSQPRVGSTLQMSVIGPYSTASRAFLFLAPRQHVPIGRLFGGLLPDDFFLRVNPAVTVGAAVPVDTAFGLPIPGEAALRGAELGVQAVVVDPMSTRNALGLGLTRGYQITIGQ